MFWHITHRSSWLPIVLLAALRIGAAEPAPVRSDYLELLNGDALRGVLLGVDGLEGAQWRHPAAENPFTVRFTGLSRVRFAPPNTLPESHPANCQVTLNNEDMLSGDLVGLEGDRLEFSTWFAGKLSIPRTSLHSLVPTSTSLKVIYEGPTSQEGWVSRQNPGVIRAPGAAQPGEVWRFADNSFYSSMFGFIGRDFKLPAVSNLEFDLAWRGFLSFAFVFHSDTLQGYGGNAYVLQFNYRNVFLYRRTQIAAMTTIGQAELPDLTSRSGMRVSLRTNKEQKTFALYIDGQLIRQWVDPQAFVSQGNGIVLMQHGQNPVRFSRFRISEWDGRLAEPSLSDTNQVNDVVHLANNDKVDGRVKNIRDGKITLTTSFSDLEIPINRVTQVTFAPVKPSKDATSEREVRLFFREYGSITLNLDRWTDQQVTGTSPNYGRLKLASDAFSQLYFNPAITRRAPVEELQNNGLPVE
jgi:hypothetical protein